jgi:hypothetical protein
MTKLERRQIDETNRRLIAQSWPELDDEEDTEPNEPTAQELVHLADEWRLA